jgi:hypothetical protein
MNLGMPTDRIAQTLVGAGYDRLASPLRVATLEFDVASAFVGAGHSADLVVVVDMAAHGEQKVLQQIEGIARALDVMRSTRPLTTIVVGPRPVGKTLEALAQVGRILPVEEALDPIELRDQLAILLPLELPTSLLSDYDLDANGAFDFPGDPLANQLVEASSKGEIVVRDKFHTALNSALEANDDGNGEV